MNVVMKYWVPQNAVSTLSNGETLSFTEMTLYHEVSCFISIRGYIQQRVT